VTSSLMSRIQAILAASPDTAPRPVLPPEPSVWPYVRPVPAWEGGHSQLVDSWRQTSWDYQVRMELAAQKRAQVDYGLLADECMVLEALAALTMENGSWRAAMSLFGAAQ
jgi:hypothetical protein